MCTSVFVFGEGLFQPWDMWKFWVLSIETINGIYSVQLKIGKKKVQYVCPYIQLQFILPDLQICNYTVLKLA